MQVPTYSGDQLLQVDSLLLSLKEAADSVDSVGRAG